MGSPYLRIGTSERVVTKIVVISIVSFEPLLDFLVVDHLPTCFTHIGMSPYYKLLFFLV